MISSAIWDKSAQVNFSKTNKIALVFSQSESSNFCMYIITTVNDWKEGTWHDNNNNNNNNKNKQNKNTNKDKQNQK